MVQAPNYLNETLPSLVIPIDAAWDLFERFDNETSGLRERIVELTGRLRDLDSKGLLSGAQRSERANLLEEQAELYAKLVATQGDIHNLTEVIEGFETGDIDEQTLAILLNDLDPQDESEDEPIARLSKRKVAIRNANLELARRMGIEEDSWEFRFTFGKNGTRVIHDNPELQTDPRRIASGRSASRLIARGALSSLDAEASFMDATADTHGGKTRQYGKNSKHYTGKSGRRIRKR